MRTRHLISGLVLLVLGGIVFTVGPALAGWVTQRAWTLPGGYASFTVTALSCNDQTEHTLQTNTVSVEAWNTSAVRDVCIAWTGTPDHSDVTSCDVVLGAYAGSGSSQVYQTPTTVSLGGLAFKCDADGATVIRVTEFVGPKP